MRVIAGTAKGRRLKAPTGHVTRPIQDRVKEALFSSLSGHVEGARVLDLYAGTGSIGLEALSRGAASAVFVERDRNVVAVLEANVSAVGLGGRVVQGDVERFIDSTTDAFDLVFVDPPYPLPHAEVQRVLERLEAHLDGGAVVVVHRRIGDPAFEVPRLELVDARNYGGAQLWRYVKESG